MACIVKKNRSPCAACRGLHKKCDTSEGFPCKGCKSNGQKARLCRPSRNRKSLRTKIVDSVRLLAGEHLEFYQGIAATNNSFHEVQADATNFFQNAGNVASNEFQAHSMLDAYVQTQEYARGNGPPFDYVITCTFDREEYTYPRLYRCGRVNL
ncbi:hypothetical protein SCHPADRAFT_406927 [Schizopora paradoxa]|uniref:Zn(2)-C6 fungal-type domain-containing protein n=1 Tax=Schizopora paradoxa TaxID=27342 RepID=A0A0H2S758_9AGAM|nr:hypothetical protein SCHPADRAFT_406927 [Schizopora paradoxa]